MRRKKTNRLILLKEKENKIINFKVAIEDINRLYELLKDSGIANESLDKLSKLINTRKLIVDIFKNHPETRPYQIYHCQYCNRTVDKRKYRFQGWIIGSFEDGKKITICNRCYTKISEMTNSI